MPVSSNTSLPEAYSRLRILEGTQLLTASTNILSIHPLQRLGGSNSEWEGRVYPSIQASHIGKCSKNFDESQH